MSPRFALALLSITAAAACAKAGNSDFADDDDGDGGDDLTTSASTSSSGGNTTGSGPTTSSASSGETTAATTSGTGGAGGSGGATTSGSTGGMGTTTTTGSGGNPNTCSHDTCTIGIPLTIGCGDPCVDQVCATDDFCCDQMGGEWDDLCVDEAVSICGAQCSAGPLAGDLVITEIMNNPSVVNDDAGEWFEIHNATGTAIDLQGLVIRHQPVATDPNATLTVGASVIVPAGGYVVLGINGNSGTNGGVAVDYAYSGINLSNTSDYLAIEDGLGTTIDEVSWDEASGLDPNGKSRNLDPLFLSDLDNDDDTHFCEASSAMTGGDTGTPGGANDPC
jgi:hypothetical protein